MSMEDLFETEHIEMNTVGIDIGSSTSHLHFSRIFLVRLGAALSSRYVVVDKQVLYESDILLTPYTSGTTIDTESLGTFINEAYQKAGMKRDDVDTGALILTGEAVKKENARAIGDLFASEAGRFVAVSAGDNLESVMSAYGSGAVEFSQRNHNTVMAVDLGGGTSKITIVQNGTILDSAAISVGARLITMDDQDVVTRLEEVGHRVGQEAGVELKVGQPISQASTKLKEMAALLATSLFNVVKREPLSPLAQKLMRTANLTYQGKVDAIVFSGGVSEYIYGSDVPSYGDMGAVLAEEIRTRAETLDIPMLEPNQRIRATVIGASQYTIQVSGNTIYLSNSSELPVRNLQVLAPSGHYEDSIVVEEVKEDILQAFHRFDLKEGESPVALALHWGGPPTYARIDAISLGILAGLSNSVSAGMPVVLVFDGDVGKLVGANLAERLGNSNQVISIDGVELREFDYVDIGEVIMPAGAVPVIIKSLVFPTLSDWYHETETPSEG